LASELKTNISICIIGLGYVGLPLARLFATKYRVTGFDTNKKRIDEIKDGIDSTGELAGEVIQAVLKRDSTEIGLYCSSLKNDLAGHDYYIITVPTPVDKNDNPDLSSLIEASRLVGLNMTSGAIVIYESTVYPGATEEVCLPILEENSKLKCDNDFSIGYSPERINPGDKEHTVDKILKVTSGSNYAAAENIDSLYKSVISAGTYLAPSIKVAEAAKVIENSQRDINIAFVNELAKIFNRMEIDTQEVLKAASTKWNFLPFQPGLVGGHCIGVDPYYLAQKAKQIGYHPEIILAGRRLNDSMGEYVASQVVKLMSKKDIKILGSKILVLGITFKEDCPDVRNTKVIDIVNDLKEYGALVSVYDPVANSDALKKVYDLELIKTIDGVKFDAVVLAVGHTLFREIDFNYLKGENSVLYDVKGFVKSPVDGRL
tara:strand:+ start:1257 stop:2549 length:1293 start_codon:yes stop_codon:yes gene_type:complete